jgi:microcystin-dependent protein
MTSTLRRPLTFAAHERATIGDSKFSFTDSDHLGWLKCDGRLLSTTDYALLHKVIGYSFGGAGMQFALPNALGRVPGAAGLPETEDLSGSPIIFEKGDISGAQLHLLTIPEMPEHAHSITDTGHTHTLQSFNDDFNNTSTYGAGAQTPSMPQADAGAARNWTATVLNNTTGISINNTGGDEYHNNMQPTIFMGNLFIFCGRYFQGVAPYTVNKGVY